MKESNLERRGEKSAIRQRRQIVASECLGLNCSAEVLSSQQSFSLGTSFGVRVRKDGKRPLTFTSLCFHNYKSAVWCAASTGFFFSIFLSFSSFFALFRPVKGGSPHRMAGFCSMRAKRVCEQSTWSHQCRQENTQSQTTQPFLPTNIGFAFVLFLQPEQNKQE